MEKLNTAYKCNDTSLHYAYIRDTDTLHNFRRENHEKKLNILPTKIHIRKKLLSKKLFLFHLERLRRYEVMVWDS